MNPHQPAPLSRRQALQLGGATVGVAAAALAPGVLAPTAALARGRAGDVTIEDLGPGVTHYAGVSSLLVGETMFVGSRNLSPSRVTGFHVPTGKVTHNHTLGNGDFVSGLAADGQDILYAGVTRATDDTNLYRVDVHTGEVTGITSVADLFIRDLAVAPDGIVYIVGRPIPFGDGPAVHSYDPATGELSQLAIPDPTSDQIVAVDATNTTVYCGCNSRLTSRTGNGVYAVDRSSGASAKVHDGDIRSFAINVLDDVLAVGAQPGDDAWFALLEISSDTWHDFDLPGGYPIGIRDGGLLVLSDHEIHRIDLASWEMTHIGTTERGSSTRLGLLGDLVIGTGGSAGFVWTYDFTTSLTEIIDLASVGANGDPQLGMSVGAGSGVAYVGGTGAVGVHDLTDGSVTTVRAGTEVKDLVVVDGVAYFGVYSDLGLWEHRAASGEPPRQIAEFPAAQNRPQVVRWDDTNNLVMVGVKADTTGGGSLCLYDPATKELTAHVNPLGEDQYVGAGAVADGVVYLGGCKDGSASTGAGHIAAWDPVAGTELWRMTNPLEQNIASLAVLGTSLFGITVANEYFVIALAPPAWRAGAAWRAGRLVHRADFSGVTSKDTTLVINRQQVYGASARSLFRVDPTSHQPTVLVDDLAGEWFGKSRLAVDENHWLYTLRGRNLIRVIDGTAR